MIATDASGARLQRWLYYSLNLWVDSNITTLSNVLTRAAQSGYTHLLLADSKFCRLGDMDAHYFANVNAVKSLATSLGIEIVPAVSPIGYSNDLLFQDPDLVEAMPITNWLNTAASFPGVVGVMYTTWKSSYGNLAAFSEFVSGWEIHNSWQLSASLSARGLQFELPTLSNASYTVWRSTNLTLWQVWTNFTGTAAIGRFLDTNLSNRSTSFYRASTP